MIIKNEPKKTITGMKNAIKFCKFLNENDEDWVYCPKQVGDKDWYNILVYDEDGIKLGYL